MNEHIKVSVIVPIYNIKEYVKRCVESIVNQTHCNLEIILVDDGSTDGSGELCDQLAVQDMRIVVIHKKNGGLADARNAGIDKATGQVLSFIDGDDYIDSGMYEVMLRELTTSVSMVVCGMIISDVNGLCLSSNVWDTTCNVRLSNEECYKAFLTEGHNGFDLSCCNKIFRKDLFEDIRFVKGLIGEDIECMYRVLDKVDNCVCVNQCLYMYGERSGSITRSVFCEKQMDYVDTVRKVRDAVECKYPELRDMAYNFELRWLIQCWNWVQGSADKSISKKWEKEIRTRIKQNLSVKKRKIRKAMGNYCLIITYSILFRCGKIINRGFMYWFCIKDWVRQIIKRKRKAKC